MGSELARSGHISSEMHNIADEHKSKIKTSKCKWKTLGKCWKSF